MLSVQIVDAADARARAALLIAAPLGVIHLNATAVVGACEENGFEFGADYVRALSAAMLSERTPTGDWPAKHLELIDSYHAALARIAGTQSAERRAPHMRPIYERTNG